MIFNIAVAKDLDGNVPVDPVDCISEVQLKQLQKTAKEVKADIKAFCSLFHIANLAVMPAVRYEEAVQQLERKRRAMAAAKATTKDEGPSL